MAEAEQDTQTAGKGCCSAHAGHGSGHGHDLSAGVTTDPVCGMSVDPQTTAHHAVHAGHEHHFCSAGCRAKFVADSDAYLNRSAEKATITAPAGSIWTCPMHPEIRQEGPGACPICGMALEPEMVSAEAGPSEELTDMTRRFRLALALSLRLILALVGMWLFGRRVARKTMTALPEVQS